MALTILIVEDNILLNNSIAISLKAEGYKVQQAINIKEAQELFLHEETDIVLLDIMIGADSSIKLIPYFKSIHKAYIVILSALSSMDSKQAAYDNGCDDYICKPFELEELSYKLRAISRNILNVRQIFKIGDLVINTEDNCLTSKNNQVQYIQPSQMKILQQLAIEFDSQTLVRRINEKQPRLLMSKDEKNRMRSIVTRLRKNIKELECNNITIESEYGRGYVLRLKNEIS